MSEKPVILVDGCVYINEKIFRKIAKKNYAISPIGIMYLCDLAVKKAHEQNREEEVAE